MKTNSKTEAAPRRSGTCLPLFALIPFALLLATLRAAEPVKDHALFVGATLRLGETATAPELVGAEGRQVAVLADGKVSFLPRKAVAAVRIEMGLKLSGVVAQIDNLKSTPIALSSGGDRFAADRMKILFDGMASQSADAMDNASRRMADASGRLTVANGFTEPGIRSELAQAQAAFDAANAKTRELHSAVLTLPSAPDLNAIEVSCDISSPKAARDAYAVLLTEYRTDARAKPRYQVHIEPLGELGPTSQRVTMTQAGLPPSFLLGRVDVHVYANGQELATNLSEQRVDLTADDALRYLVVCYVAAHGKDSLAASPLRITLPADFKRQAPAAELERPLYVTVGGDGAVRDLSAAPDRAVPVDPYVDSAVRKFRYNPALKEGKPVESVVAVTLSEYLR